jgi:hypothetical protein
MCTPDTRPATFVPREIQNAIQRSLERSDEAVLHAIGLLDREASTPEHLPDTPWYWLVVTDRQLLFVPHDDGAAGARPRLALPMSAILGIEVGAVLLRTWMTIYADAAQVVRPDAECEPWYVLGNGPANEESTDPVLTAQRIEFHYSTLPAVQAAVRDLITEKPYLAPSHPGADLPRNSRSLLSRLEPVVRPMVRALLADGEGIRTVLFAPPDGPERGRKRRQDLADTRAGVRTWRGVVVTDRRILLLELPPPHMPDGLRYETTVIQVAPEAMREVTILPAQQGIVELQLRLQRGAAEMLWPMELDEQQAPRWMDGVARLEDLVRAAKLPMHTEYRRFVATTGLQDIVLTSPAHYAIVLKQIKEHRYYLGEHGRTTSMREAAEDWYRSLYSPITEQLTARGGLDGTPADMYMRLCEYKWLASERLGADIGFDLALQAFQYWVA